MPNDHADERFTKPVDGKSSTSKRSNALTDIVLPIMHPICRTMVSAKFRPVDIPCKRGVSGTNVILERVVPRSPPAAAIVLVRQGLTPNMCPEDVNDPRFFVRVVPL